jgi:two-component system sensor histidine kinase CpxA
MTRTPVKLPLLGKMLLWLLLHLSLLGLIAAALAFQQFQHGWDTLLRSSAGGQLRVRGEQIAAQLRGVSPHQWADVTKSIDQEFSVQSDFWMPHGEFLEENFQRIPPALEKRLRTERSPVKLGPQRRDPRDQRDRFGPPPHEPGEPMEQRAAPPSRPLRPQENQKPPSRPLAFEPVAPLFLISDQGRYWVAVHIPLQPGQRPDHVTWVISADQLSGNGLYFQFKPVLLVACGILLFSVLFWIPFAIHITKYVKKLHIATEQIAAGNFQPNLATKRRDELGSLGTAIKRMAQRIDQLLRGQKRFLADVAHELCSPLARLRTGLGILEHKLPESEKSRITSIEEDAAELAELINELLDFTKSSLTIDKTKLQSLNLPALIESCRLRYIADHSCRISMPENFQILADEKLIKRAIGNLFQNIHRHAGESAAVTIAATASATHITLTIADDGPGVPADQLERIFEPFYRVDTTRTRDTGGTGLGLAIVRNCITACHGTITVQNQNPSGLQFQMILPLAK